MLTWYLAKLIYFVAGETLETQARFEERWMMVQADENRWAREKAMILARLSEKNQPARFVQVAEVVEVNELEGVCLKADFTSPASAFVGRAATA